MKTYIVQLEDHDDVISARDKISWSKARRVLLVWPRRGRVLERRVDLLLLQRHSQQNGAQVDVVTQSSAVGAYAGELGIPVFSDAVHAQQASWRTRVRRKGPLWGAGPLLRAGALQEVGARRETAEGKRRPVDPEMLRDARRQHWVLKKGAASRLVENRWARLGVFSLGLLAFLVLGLSFLPGAEVAITPVRKTQNLTIAVWANPEIHAPNASGGLPAQAVVVTVEGRDQADSTGKASIPNQFATGQVLLTNLGDQPVDIPLASVVLGGSGQGQVRFVTTQAVQVPASPGQAVKVAIRAAQAGKAANLPAGKIKAMEGPAGLSLMVDNPDPTSGGTDLVSRAPTAQDYRALKDKLLNHLRSSALDEARAGLQPGQRLLEGALALRSVLEEQREPAEGQPADQLQIALRVEYEAWYVREADLQAVAQAALDANRESGFQPVAGSLNITFASEPRLEEGAPGSQPGAADSGKGSDAGSADAVAANAGSAPAASAPAASTRWELKIERMVEASFSPSAVISAIRGRSTTEAARVLQAKLQLAEAPRIRMWPGWWGRLPFLPARIQVLIQ